MTLVPPDAGRFRSMFRFSRGALIERLNERYADFAQKHELKVTHSEYDPRHFGHSVVILDGKSFRIRLTNGKDPLFADLAAVSEPEKWWSLTCIHKAIFGDFPALDRRLNSSALLDANMALLEANYRSYAQSLGPDYAAIRNRLQFAGLEVRARTAQEIKEFLAKQSPWPHIR